MKARPYLVLAALILIFVLLIFALVAVERNINSPEPTPVPTPTVTVTPTDVPATPTQEPTPTEIPATPTEVPTDTPTQVPTETPVETITETPTPVEPTAAPEVQSALSHDIVAENVILLNIQGERTKLGRDMITRSEGLDKIAAAYAEALYEGGVDFRANTDFLTLPNGERVSSLMKETGYTGTASGFTYSVWYSNYSDSETVLTTLSEKAAKSQNQYINKYVDSDRSKIGIAAAVHEHGDGTRFAIVILVGVK